MNPRTIDVLLTVSGDADVLVFALDEECPDFYTVSLSTSSSQNDLQKVFSKLLQMLLDEDIVLSLTIADGYSKGLQKDVCLAYIDDLNRELVQVKTSMSAELA